MRPVLVVAGGGGVTGGRDLQGRRGSGTRAPAALLRHGDEEVGAGWNHRCLGTIPSI